MRLLFYSLLIAINVTTLAVASDYHHSPVTTDTSSKDVQKIQKEFEKIVDKGISDRRDELRVRCDIIADEYGQKVHKKVTVEQLLFATMRVDASHDSAILLIKVGDAHEAMLAVFQGDLNDGKWDVFPEDWKTISSK